MIWIHPPEDEATLQTETQAQPRVSTALGQIVDTTRTKRNHHFGSSVQGKFGKLQQHRYIHAVRGTEPGYVLEHCFLLVRKTTIKPLRIWVPQPGSLLARAWHPFGGPARRLRGIDGWVGPVEGLVSFWVSKGNILRS